PPERSLLQGATAQAGHQELEDPAGLVGAMGEVTMVAGCDAEHAHEVQQGTQGQVESGEAGQEDRQADQVNRKKGNVPQPGTGIRVAAAPLPQRCLAWRACLGEGGRSDNWHSLGRSGSGKKTRQGRSATVCVVRAPGPLGAGKSVQE